MSTVSNTSQTGITTPPKYNVKKSVGGKTDMSLRSLQSQYPELNITTKPVRTQSAVDSIFKTTTGKNNVVIDPKVLKQAETDPEMAKKIHDTLSRVNHDKDAGNVADGEQWLGSGTIITGDGTVVSFVRTDKSTDKDIPKPFTGKDDTVVDKGKTEEEIRAERLAERQAEEDRRAEEEASFSEADQLRRLEQTLDADKPVNDRGERDGILDIEA